MRKTNYQQLRKQRESTRKARQSEKLARRSGSATTDAEVAAEVPAGTDATPIVPDVKPS